MSCLQRQVRCGHQAEVSAVPRLRLEQDPEPPELAVSEDSKDGY
jgi:hypothetical protein